MSDELVTIDIPETRLRIYGKYRHVHNAPVIIMVHGNTENMDGYLRTNFSRELEQAGYSSFRFSFYDYFDDARSLIDTTIDVHTQDLRLVLNFLRQQDGTRPQILLSHSLGVFPLLQHGPTDIAAAALWDPSGISWTKGESPGPRQWIPELNAYRVFAGVDYLISKDMLISMQKLQPFEMIKRFTRPIFIANAGDGVLLEDGQRYFNSAVDRATYEIIPHADHGFTSDETSEALFSKTISWLNQQFK